MLGIGLMLFALRGLTARAAWSDRLLRVAFWALNLGLAVMVLLSLLPIGLIQAEASMSEGLWYARSADLLQEPHMEVLRWLRVPGDVIFSLGVGALGLFGWRLLRGGSPQPAAPDLP